MSRARAGAAYFDNQLNYTIGDEDSRLEWSLLAEGRAHVACIAGSGGRVLPLVARRPERLSCIDVSPPQLRLAELRLAAARWLDRERYAAFLGYPTAPAEAATTAAAEPGALDARERERIFDDLTLAPATRAFFAAAFEAIDWQPLAYRGRFERMLRTLARVNRVFTGRAGARLFEARSLAEQRAYLEHHFPRRAWNAVLLVMGNAPVLNSLLYKGDLPRQNVPGSAFRVYQAMFARLFANVLARESYFLQLLFFGALRFPEGNPAECDRDIYAAAHAALQHTAIDYVAGDVVEWLRAPPRPVDFVSLSDVPTFFKGAAETSFLQDIRPGLSRGALVVTRGHLRVCHPDTRGYDVVTGEHAEAIARERTQLWHVEVYRAQ